MPELPELEVVCDVLRRRVLGRTDVTHRLSPTSSNLSTRSIAEASTAR